VWHRFGPGIGQCAGPWLAAALQFAPWERAARPAALGASAARRPQPKAASTSVSSAIAANSRVRYEIEYL